MSKYRESEEKVKSQDENQSLSRDFKGIWIPREIWLYPRLCITAKSLWAEIDSLFCPEKGGCYASNEYLASFLGVKERRLQELIHILKDEGLLEQVSFDGRKRILKAVMPQVQKNAPQRCGKKSHGRGAEKCTPKMQKSAPLTYIENKDYNKERRRTKKQDNIEKNESPPCMSDVLGDTQDVGGGSTQYGLPLVRGTDTQKKELQNKERRRTKKHESPPDKENVVVVVSDKIKKTAQKLKEEMDQFIESNNLKWKFPKIVFEKLLKTYSIEYILAHCRYLVNSHFANPIEKPVAYIEIACKNNYANFDPLNNQEII